MAIQMFSHVLLLLGHKFFFFFFFFLHSSVLVANSILRTGHECCHQNSHSLFMIYLRGSEL